ncbi:hypothetical protein MMC11_001597 [Xylographa trunciseda]|nr:hypothetical protein [Xylographa trunciseda]
MSYSIVAGVCHHHIRYDTHLPYPASGSNQDFGTPYCPTCLSEQAIQARHSHASADYSSYSDRDRDHPDRHDARRRLDSARIDLAHQQYERDDRTRAALAARPARHRPLDLTPEERAFIHGPAPRFDRSADYVPESEYRDPGSYCRRRDEYEPGRHADTSGYGYLNTSDPAAAARREARRREREAEAGGGSGRRTREVTPHPGRYGGAYEDDERRAEEEEERIRRIKDDLYRYRDV